MMLNVVINMKWYILFVFIDNKYKVEFFILVKEFK